MKSSCHRFQPHGLTIAFILAESHIAYHSWPERSYASIDLISCREVGGIERNAEAMKRALGAAKIKIRRARRTF